MKTCGVLCLLLFILGAAVVIVSNLQPPVRSPARAVAPKPKPSMATYAKIFAQKHIETAGTFQVLRTDLVKETPPFKIYLSTGLVNGPGTSLPFEVLFVYDSEKERAWPQSVNYGGRNVFDLDATIKANQ